MNFESLLIVTYGRSGSTLLQGLLNSIDGCVVRGENHDLCRGLFDAWQSLQNTKLKHGKGEASLSPTSPWFGAAALSEDQFILDARTLMLHQLMGPLSNDSVSCLGFKEIRYLPPSLAKKNKGNLSEYLDFLAKLFPNPAFIILTREHEQVANSAWWQDKKTDQVKRQLVTFEQEVKTYSKDKPWVYPINYDDITKRSDRLKDMFMFLGAPYIEDRVAKVLATKHSYTHKPDRSKTIQNNIGEMKGEKLISYLLIDKPVQTAGKSEGYTLKGVVVLVGSELVTRYKLIVKNSIGEKNVTWGLPSPRIGMKFPSNPVAALSRFKVENLKFQDGSSCELILVNDRGSSWLLGKANINQSES